ncbi:MAG: phosphodiester glycosidase family protein [bacterium]|nr:phosphodiester glycosidase family protein [bacterium]
MKKEIDHDQEKMPKRKRMNIIKMCLIDVGMLAASMGIFLYFDYLKPQTYSLEGTTVVSNEKDSATFSLPTETTSPTPSGATTSEGSSSASSNKTSHSMKGGKKGMGNTGTSEIASDSEATGTLSTSDITATKLQSITSDTTNLTITKKEVGSGSDKITYYVADIYVTNVSSIKSAFAENTYGKNIKTTVETMAQENNALLAINGDFYGNSEEGVVIRNGVLYRSNVNDADICVLFQDGTMKTYAGNEFDGDAVIASGAWQAWNFGPSLLDGNGAVASSFQTTSYLNSNNPRTAIGYVEAGHYVMVVVDGRKEGYSRGCSLTELAQFMSLEGCKTAYNLDGGNSSAMIYNGSYINQPSSGGREVSDIVYVAS